MPTTRTWTDEELMALPRDGFKRELVGGEIVVSPAGAPHGRVIMKLARVLGNHVDAMRAGFLLDSSTGIRMPSGNLRSPDLTFVSHERLPTGIPEGFLAVVPDLTVEVLSPGDSVRGINDKVGEYLTSGVRLVWIIDRLRRSAVAWRSRTDFDHLTEEGTLDGGEVVPDFSVRLGDLFD